MPAKHYELAWHFVRSTNDGNYAFDYNYELLTLKKWYKAKGKIALCFNGYHASKDLQDAYDHVSGEGACLVQIDGQVIRDTRKLVAQKRRALFVKPATEDVLQLFYVDEILNGQRYTTLDWEALESALCDGEDIP